MKGQTSFVDIMLLGVVLTSLILIPLVLSFVFWGSLVYFAHWVFTR